MFYKMDASGNGKEINIDEIKTIRELQAETWTHSMFLSACILSGCDYVDSIKSIGAKKAFKLIAEKRNFKKVSLLLFN